MPKRTHNDVWNAVVADSNVQRAKAIRRELRAYGISVCLVHSFDHAVHVIQSGTRPPAVFVADAVAPLHGIDLLAQTEQHLVGTPIIAAVCSADSVIARILRKSGVIVLVQPDSTAVVTAIRRIIGDRTARRPSITTWSRLRRRPAQRRLAARRRR